MNLEQELRRRFETEKPAERLRRQSAVAASRQVTLFATPATIRRWPRVALPVAASLMLAFGGTYYVHRQQERQAREQLAQTEHAARDVVLALQIASEKISAAQAKVEEITRYEPTNDSVAAASHRWRSCSPRRRLGAGRQAAARSSQQARRRRPTETVDVSVDTAMLKQAAGFLAGKGSDTEKVQQLLDGITGIYVKSFEFDAPNVYAESDVEAVRKQVSRLRMVARRRRSRESAS